MVTSLVGRRLIASYGLWIMTLGAAVTTVSVLVVAAGCTSSATATRCRCCSSP
ncbi:hypothetical protein LT493_02315 [Streptomyces tricolor]|nr:hypothetical protein [Streptomyces tricolor]